MTTSPAPDIQRVKAVAPKLEFLVTLRSQLAEDLQRCYQFVIEKLDTTPWHFGNAPALARATGDK